MFSAWDSATRNAAAAVVNSGGNAPPAPPAPCQVTSHVIVAIAVNAPPSCPPLEVMQVCSQSGAAGLATLVYGVTAPWQVTAVPSPGCQVTETGVAVAVTLPGTVAVFDYRRR